MDCPFNLICFQVFVCAPIDLVKVRLQGQTSAEQYRGSIHCVGVILREEGPRGLYRGGLALALRDVPCHGLYFMPYEVTRRALTETGKEPGQFWRQQHRPPLTMHSSSAISLTVDVTE